MEHDAGDHHGASGSEPIPPAAESLFGDRLQLASAYWESLASVGVERGLIGPREVPRLWERHIVNCAVAAELIPEGASVLDIGSGAGLPGIPLAMARPDLSVTLLEPLLRRSDYLTEFAKSVDLRVKVVRGRAEERSIIRDIGGADIVTSRAVAPLAKLARWSLPLVRIGGVMLALKGDSAEDEIARDRDVIARLGGRGLEIVRCGVDLVESPTIVVRAERGGRTRPAPARHASPRPARPHRSV